MLVCPAGQARQRRARGGGEVVGSTAWVEPKVNRGHPGAIRQVSSTHTKIIGARGKQGAPPGPGPTERRAQPHGRIDAGRREERGRTDKYTYIYALPYLYPQSHPIPRRPTFVPVHNRRAAGAGQQPAGVGRLSRTKTHMQLSMHLQG